MNGAGGVPANIRVVLSADQIQKRVRELGRQVSLDFRGKTIQAVCVLEGGFVFMADLLRTLEAEVVCHFIRPDFREIGNTTEIFYSPEPDVRNTDVLLVETLIESGVTCEFLVRNLLARGAASVKVITLLDRHASRRVSLQPDYLGFLVNEPFVFGYGLGSPRTGRNLPYIAAAEVQANVRAT